MTFLVSSHRDWRRFSSLSVSGASVRSFWAICFALSTSHWNSCWWEFNSSSSWLKTLNLQVKRQVSVILIFPFLHEKRWGRKHEVVAVTVHKVPIFVNTLYNSFRKQSDLDLSCYNWAQNVIFLIQIQLYNYTHIYTHTPSPHTMTWKYTQLFRWILYYSKCLNSFSTGTAFSSVGAEIAGLHGISNSSLPRQKHHLLTVLSI